MSCRWGREGTDAEKKAGVVGKDMGKKGSTKASMAGQPWLCHHAQGNSRPGHPSHLWEHILMSSRTADFEVSVAEADPWGSDTGLEMPRTEVACAPEQSGSLAEQEMQEALPGWQGPLSYFRDSAKNGLGK